MDNETYTSGQQGSSAPDRNYPSGHASDQDKYSYNARTDQNSEAQSGPAYRARAPAPTPLRFTTVEPSVSSTAGQSRPNYDKSLPQSPTSATSHATSQGTGDYIPGALNRGTFLGPGGVQTNVNVTEDGFIFFNPRLQTPTASLAASSPHSPVSRRPYPASPLSARFSVSGGQGSPTSPTGGLEDTDAAPFYTLSEKERQRYWESQSDQSQQGRNDSGGSGP